MNRTIVAQTYDQHWTIFVRQWRDVVWAWLRSNTCAWTCDGCEKCERRL